MKNKNAHSKATQAIARTVTVNDNGTAVARRDAHMTAGHALGRTGNTIQTEGEVRRDAVRVLKVLPSDQSGKGASTRPAQQLGVQPLRFSSQ